MRHHSARRRLAQLGDDTLPEGIEREVRAHVSRCGACAERLAEYEACERLLARLPHGVIPLAAPAGDAHRLAGLARWGACEPPRRRLAAGPELPALLLAAAAIACVVALTGTSRWVPDPEPARTTTQLAFVVPTAWGGP